MKSILSVLAFGIFLAAAGCHAQLPTTTYAVNLTWTAATGCSTSLPCTYAVSRAAQVNGSCPATTTVGTYAQIGTSASQATAYSDTTAPASSTQCYIVQTQQVETGQTQPSTSAPSNTFSIAIPAVPVAPALSTPTVTETSSNNPPAPAPTTEPELAVNAPRGLRAERVPVR